jgi:hypothetical protein
MEEIEEKIEELDKTMDNLDLEDQSEDFMICYDDTSDKSMDTWKTGLDQSKDSLKLQQQVRQPVSSTHNRRGQLRGIRRKQQPSTQPSKYKQRSKSSGGRQHRRVSGK